MAPFVLGSRDTIRSDPLKARNWKDERDECKNVIFRLVVGATNEHFDWWHCLSSRCVVSFTNLSFGGRFLRSPFAYDALHADDVSLQTKWIIFLLAFVTILRSVKTLFRSINNENEHSLKRRKLLKIFFSSGVLNYNNIKGDGLRPFSLPSVLQAIVLSRTCVWCLFRNEHERPGTTESQHLLLLNSIFVRYYLLNSFKAAPYVWKIFVGNTQKLASILKFTFVILTRDIFFVVRRTLWWKDFVEYGI